MKIKNTLIALILGLFLSTTANAQVQAYYGGVGIGSQAPQGLLFSALYIPIYANQLNNPNGDEISTIDLGTGPMPTEFDLNVQVAVLAGTWVSDIKILGATYSAAVFVPYAASRKVSYTATAPDGSVISLMDQSTSGLCDVIVTPLSLGWSKKHWDISTGLAINMPIGDFDAGAANRWSFMPNIGGTYYFDSMRTSSASARFTFEFNGSQQYEDTDLSYGDEMIVEWGLGKMFLKYKSRFGLIGYSVFQLNEDKGTDATSTDLHSTHSIGGEYLRFFPSKNLSILVRGATALSAKDTAPISVFMVGITKTFGLPKRSASK